MISIKEQLRDMYEAPTLEECKKRKDQIVKKYSEYAPRAMKVLDNRWADIIFVYAFP